MWQPGSGVGDRGGSASGRVEHGQGSVLAPPLAVARVRRPWLGHCGFLEGHQLEDPGGALLATRAQVTLTPGWRRLVAALCVILAALVVAPDAASARIDARAESDLMQRLNAERARRRLPPLRARTDLRDVARGHSVHMAQRGRLFHNPRLGAEVCCWQELRENVGYAEDPRHLHRLFMTSSPHRANILSRRLTDVGVGVERRGDVVWVTQVFRLRS